MGPESPQGPQSLSRLVVPWPRHVSELSSLRDILKRVRTTCDLGNPQHNCCDTFSLSAAQLRASHTASVSPYLYLSARPIWHSKMQLHVSKWSVRICRPWWHRRRACREVACARRHWAVCHLKHTGLSRRHLRLQSSSPVQPRLGAPATGGVLPEKLFANSATRLGAGKSVGRDGRLLATSIILENDCSSPFTHGQHNAFRCALLRGLCVSCSFWSVNQLRNSSHLLAGL